jgi:hypothetical protein
MLCLVDTAKIKLSGIYAGRLLVSVPAHGRLRETKLYDRQLGRKLG